MRIAIGADHAGYELKDHLGRLLAVAGHEIVDVGTNSGESCDYPDFGKGVAALVAAGEAERGLLVCGTGIGISIAANRVKGVRAARCLSEFDARFARLHNDANVLAIGSRVTGIALAEAILEAFFNTGFEGGRHQRRIDRIDE